MEHYCPSCDSILVQLANWNEQCDGHRSVQLRCPECEGVGPSISAAAAVELLFVLTNTRWFGREGLVALGGLERAADRSGMSLSRGLSRPGSEPDYKRLMGFEPTTFCMASSTDGYDA